MTIEINLVDEVLDILQLANVKANDVDYDGVLHWLYANTDKIAGFLLGKYRTDDLNMGDNQSYEELAELIVERLQGE